MTASKLEESVLREECLDFAKEIYSSLDLDSRNSVTLSSLCARNQLDKFTQCFFGPFTYSYQLKLFKIINDSYKDSEGLIYSKLSYKDAMELKAFLFAAFTQLEDTGYKPEDKNHYLEHIFSK
ncbi:MAG: hypothetical protein JSR97_02050 [Verrucomicrobia bacterium]|nr:hypothetical protein [Verrucomicrobiota bacterium]